MKVEDLLINSDNNINNNQDNASAVQANTQQDTHITINHLSEKSNRTLRRAYRRVKRKSKATGRRTQKS